MLQSFRFTLYDFFGYLLPGAIATLAVLTFGWATFFPSAVVSFTSSSKELWTACAVASYFAGHLIQGIGNAFTKLLRSPEEEVFGEASDGSCKALVKAAKAHLE